ncbi:MAG TPA: ABC transporter ATP-binding protein [Steroidobacteraceae bacterium]|nr:ABC transporter ATP-binding protein [Steroidobacteraceae bacterium]
MTAIVSLVGVTKGYVRGNQRVEVLRNVDFQVQAGEFVVLMGPSGSGKTTLLNLMGGLNKADAGEVIVDGANLNDLSPNQLADWRAKHLGFVFQFYYLLPALSAERNVEVALFLTRLSAAERRRRVAAALDLVGLRERARHKPGELSGGQQQRVAIARAIVADPTLLICDEPTGDLDREASASILELLQLLNRRHGKTIAMVTHDPWAAEYASRQVHLDKGSLAIAPGARV